MHVIFEGGRHAELWCVIYCAEIYYVVIYYVVECCDILCCRVLWYTMLCCAVIYYVVECCDVLCCAVLWCVAMGSMWWDVVWCDVVWYTMLQCDVCDASLHHIKVVYQIVIWCSVVCHDVTSCSAVQHCGAAELIVTHHILFHTPLLEATFFLPPFSFYFPYMKKRSRVMLNLNQTK